MPIIQSTAFGPTNTITGRADPQFNYQNILSADQEAANATQLQIQRMQQQAEAQRQALANQADAYRVDRESSTQLGLGQMSSDTQRRGQDTSLLGILRGHDVTEAGDRLRSEDTRRGQDINQQIATRQQDFDLSEVMAPINWQRERFNTVFPLLTGVLRDFTGSGPGGFGDDTGMWRGPPPSVVTGDIFSPQQTQQQINAAIARNAAAAANQQQRLTQSAGARGLAGSSPLLSALSTGLISSQMGANAEASREIQLAHAKENAQHRLAGEVARDRGWVDYNNAITQRREIAAQQQNALLMALAGML